jgi:predicted dehydrogenase
VSIATTLRRRNRSDIVAQDGRNDHIVVNKNQKGNAGMTTLRIGLVGLGLVAQVVHLPVLRTMPDRFEVVAGCDLSLSNSEAVAARHAIPRVYPSVEAMLGAERLDVVAVLNSDEYHADATVAALKAGCHVLLEKPICLNLADVAAMIAARDAAQRQVMVGYMRRQSDAYRRLKAALGPAPDILHVAVRDIVGPNAYFNDKKKTLLVAGDLPAAAVRDRASRAARQVRTAIGEVSEASVNAFRLLNKLCSHDLSALRGLVGSPRRVIAASCKRNGRYVSALLDYGSFTANFEAGGDQVGRFDAHIEIFTGDRRWRIQYDNPYVSHLPTRLLCHGSGDEPFSLVETARSPYAIEWLALWQALVNGEPFEATLEDAMEDVRLAIEIVGAFGPEDAAG